LSIYPRGTNSFTVHNPDRTGTTRIRVAKGRQLEVQIDGVPKPHILRVRLPKRPVNVTRDGTVLVGGSDWNYDATDHRLWITGRQASAARYSITTN
jgi:hypothetical protein